MPLTRRRVTDSDALKALAHPVRLALLETLVTEGPMTATQAAQRVGSSPSNCSWHLRKLAEHGFVREARGHAGRNRPWQAVSQGLDWGEPDDTAADPTDRIAAEALTDLLVEREVQRLRAAQASRDTEPAAWQEVTGLVSSMLWLTAEEAADLRRPADRPVAVAERALRGAGRAPGHPSRGRPAGVAGGLAGARGSAA